MERTSSDKESKEETTEIKAPRDEEAANSPQKMDLGEDKKAAGLETDSSVSMKPSNKEDVLSKDQEKRHSEDTRDHNDDDDDDDDGDFVEDFPVVNPKKKRKSTGGQKPKKKKQKIQIKIHTKIDQVEALFNDTYTPRTSPFRSEIKPQYNYTEDLFQIDQEAALRQTQIDQMLRFYGETHEEQLPEVIAFNKEKDRQLCHKELKRLEAEDEAMRKEIHSTVQHQLKEKQEQINRGIERLRNKCHMDEKAELDKLEQMHKEKCALNQTKIQQSIKMLTKRHQQEMQKQANNHRQLAQSKGMIEQMANAVWSRESQKLQVRHQHQLQEFYSKGDSIKEKSETEYLREREKRHKSYLKRQEEIVQHRQKTFGRLNQGFQQTHQRYIKRHVQRLRKRQTAILSKMGGVTPEVQMKPNKSVLATDEEGRVELRPPSPIKSYMEPGTEPTEPIAAVSRQKHRKAILSTIPKQLSIEIHNEGLWISAIPPENSSGTATKGKDERNQKNEGKPAHTEFIPWGLDARQMLHSVVCGEMPAGLEKRFDFGDSLSTQGGHVRAVITDLRTGLETASRQRAESVKEQEEDTLRELEKKADALQQHTKDADRALAKAEVTEKDLTADLGERQKDHEKAKKLLQGFRIKFGRFFGPDGRVHPNSASEKDTRKLVDASHRYTSNLATAEKRVKAAAQALSEAQTQVQKCHNQIKQTQKAAASAMTLLRKRKALTQDSKRFGRPTKQSETIDAERASVRVNDVVSAFKRTAEKRRNQHAEKRTSSGSTTWVHSLPTLPGALKKILWHKMHRRRRQQIVLRPNQEQILEELKGTIREHFQTAKGKEKGQVEQKIQRAEQLFLLATHPVPPEGKSLPAVPSTTTNDPWAEPGWHLDLSVPKAKRDVSAILPKSPEFGVFTDNFCEIATAPGRQAASFLGTTHLRSLTSPLSSVAQAISLAETTPMSSKKEVELSENDPLNISEGAMKVGYSFVVRVSTKSASQTKRKSSSKDESAAALKKEIALEDSSSRVRAVSSNKGTGSGSTTAIPTGHVSSPPPPIRRALTKGETKSRRRPSKADPSPKGKAALAKSTQQPQPQLQPQPHSQPQPYMPQQQGNSMGIRGVYPQGQAGQLDSQYGQQYMKPVTSPAQATPAQLQQLQVQPQQIQQTLAPQQQLLPQRQPFSSPQQFQQQQQQQQQQQMAQLRMIQQAGARQGYPQGHPGHPMQFFNPAMAQRQPSFTAQQPLTMPVGARGVGPPVLGVAPRQPPQRRSSQQNGDDQNDPLFMLSDM